MNVDEVRDIFRYQFGHCFLTSFGFDFGSILASFGMKFNVCSQSFFDALLYQMLMDFDNNKKN